MSKLADTIPIIFHPGTFGTYLEYVLNTWTTAGENLDVNLEPFTDLGSSHNYKGNHVNDLRGWINYTNQADYTKFVRLHPKTLASDSVSTTVSNILQSVNLAIYIRPEDDNKLWVLNNIGTKIWDDWLSHELSDRLNVIYENWPVSRNTALNDMPKWIVREFLSFYLIPAWQDMVGDHCQDVKESGLIIIPLRNLIERPVRVFNSLAMYLGFEFTVDNEFLQNIHADMMSRQTFYNRDIYCDNIVRAILDKDSIVNWQGLTLIDEAYIQHQLRLNNLELACHGLDVFPGSVKDILPFIVAKHTESATIES